MADALQLIAENKRTKGKSLDLGNCGLTKVPPEVGELVWLESLALASAWQEREGGEKLQISSQNTGESNDNLTDIRPLAGLSALQSLHINDTQIKDLAPLAGLSALETLYAWSTPVSDLTPLAGLSALRTLVLQAARVTDLAPLAHCRTSRS